MTLTPGTSCDDNRCCRVIIFGNAYGQPKVLQVGKVGKRRRAGNSILLILCLAACDSGGGSSSSSEFSEAVFSGTGSEENSEGIRTGECSLILSSSNGSLSGTFFKGTDVLEFTGTISGSTISSASLIFDEGSLPGSGSISGSEGSRKITLSFSASGYAVDAVLEEQTTGVKKLKTAVSSASSGASRAVASSVEEFVIGSADIFAFSYSGGHFQTPSYDSDSGNMYENDVDAVQIIDSMSFTSDDPTVASFNPLNLPDTIDILYFDNEWHGVKIDGTWYADIDDRYPNVSNASNWANLDGLNDGKSDGDTFVEFDIVFIKNSLLSQTTLYKATGFSDSLEGGSYSDYTKLTSVVIISGQAGTEALALQVADEVRHVETTGGYMLLIPMASIDINEIDNIVLSVDMDNLVEGSPVSTGGTPAYDVQYSLDGDSAPVSYTLTTN